MKKILVLFLLFISNNIISQKSSDEKKILVNFEKEVFEITKSKIFFRNGTNFIGDYKLIATTSAIESPKIMYSPTHDTQYIKGFNEIERIRVYTLDSEKNKDSLDYFFKKYKNKELLIRKEKFGGKLELYVDIVYHTQNINIPFGFGINISLAQKTDKPAYQEFYLGKKYSLSIDKLPRYYLSTKKTKKILLKYTSSCKKITEKIDKTKSFSIEKIRNIIKEYNTFCK